MNRSTRTTLSFALALALGAAGGAPAYAQQQQQQQPAAAPLDLAQTLARIEAARNSVNTVDAQFEQQTRMGLFAQTLTASGRMMVQRPNRVRWEITGNNAGVFIVSGSQVSYHTGNSGGTAQANQIGPMGNILGDITAFIGGSLTGLQARYAMTVASGPNGAVVLTARPTAANVASQVDHVTLTFRPDLRMIESMDIVSPNNQGSTHIAIRSAQLNAHLPGNAFTP